MTNSKFTQRALPASVLALCMIITMLPVRVPAENVAATPRASSNDTNVAQIGGTMYESLQDAIDEAADGGTTIYAKGDGKQQR